MSISNEILKLIGNDKVEWNEIYNKLKSLYPKGTISSAKHRLIQQGKIKEETINGKKYLSIVKEIKPANNSNLLYNYKNTLKDYFKNKILQNNNPTVLDIREYATEYLKLEISDIIGNNPYKAREELTKIFIETYKELYNEEPYNYNLPIKFKNFIGRKKLLSQITSEDIGKIVEFEGTIIQSSKIMSRITKATYLCMNCGKKIKKDIDLWEAPNKKKVVCPECEKNMAFIEEESERTNFQELLIQQNEITKDGKQHANIVFIEGMERGIFGGKVKITAIPIVKSKNNSSVSEIFLYGIYCELIEEFEININDDDIDKIKTIAKDPEVIDKISNYMFRSIHGHEIIKKSIFLQQIKGSYKDGDKQNINILLIADPGCGKTSIMKELEKYPNVKYASITTASGPGLTAAVVREKTEFGDGWVIKPGVYAQADGGTACIDELTANKSVYPYLLEPLESQKITVDKAGINVSLNARCATLAACNPKHGCFDPNKSVIEQIDLPPQLIDRFDLIFPIRNNRDLKEVKELAKHIIKYENNKILGKEDTYEINGIKLSEELISKYIVYAEKINPVISDEAGEIILNYYLEMVKNSKKNNTFPVSSRQLKAILRIAEAHAKARLSDVVEEIDAINAISIMDYCLREVAYDPERGGIDIGKMYSIPKSKVDKVEKVKKVVEQLSEESENDMAHEEDIIEVCEKEYGISSEEVIAILEILYKLGEAYNPKYGYWRIT